MALFQKQSKIRDIIKSKMFPGMDFEDPVKTHYGYEEPEAKGYMPAAEEQKALDDLGFSSTPTLINSINRPQKHEEAKKPNKRTVEEVNSVTGFSRRPTMISKLLGK